jgi:hypothetical protein
LRPRENLSDPRTTGAAPIRPKTGFPVACPAAQTPLYVRPLQPGSSRHTVRVRPTPALPQSVDPPDIFDQSETAMPPPDRSRRSRRFRSLRLSVRTPPFHGGESGSIPLGSAIDFNGLVSSWRSFGVSRCPISTYGCSGLAVVTRPTARPKTSPRRSGFP